MIEKGHDSTAVTYWKTIVQWHNQDIDIDMVKKYNIFITTKIPVFTF